MGTEPQPQDGETIEATPSADERRPLSDDLVAVQAPESTQDFDLDSWAVARGVTVELAGVDHCEAANLGPDPGATLWCTRRVEGNDGTVSVVRTLHAARGARLVKLFEIPVAAGVLQEGPPRLVVELRPVAGGTRVDFSESDGLTCDSALAALAEEAESAPGTTGPLVKLVKKVCAARGAYDFVGGTLVRRR